MAHEVNPGATNRLASETSPYLQQHAHNPVDWQPWGPEALQRAHALRKPILLSIGYSACHWCHVMAHESFEDPATARVMNELFVNIKVDREERPDIDKIYQLAHQMLTQRGGGWPLTMFLTHDDQRPFFGGTYFPDKPRYGMPAFADLLRRVAEYYREHGEEMRAQNASLVAAFDDLVPPPTAADTLLDDAPLRAARRDNESQFDRKFGGFGGAPKFPHPTIIDRLLRDWYATANNSAPDLQALFMATLTLTRMAEGGIYDQLGGGFSRYSVDAYWMIPHFEKMLYDNGSMLSVYADAAVATGDALFARVCAETADWLMRDMQSPQGGYYSSLDADSEGHEGKFYVWQPAELRALLPTNEYEILEARFGLDREANFEGKDWHLHAFKAMENVASEHGLTLDDAATLLDAARSKLLRVRTARIWPGRDEKILTSWNALAIRGMASAASTLGRQDIERSATRALDFIRQTLWRDGRLLATAKDGKAHLSAYLDDYAYLADAILQLASLRWRGEEIAFAQQLLDVLLAHFEDRERGGFYFTADDHETLIHRSKTFADEAIPSGNGVAAQVLLRYGYLLGEPRYLAAAERTLRASWQVLGRHPSAHMSLLNALEEYLNPPEIVILRGTATAMAEWQRELARRYAPHRLVLAIPANANGLPAALGDKTPHGNVVAYSCRGNTCSAPIAILSGILA